MSNAELPFDYYNYIDIEKKKRRKKEEVVGVGKQTCFYFLNEDQTVYTDLSS